MSDSKNSKSASSAIIQAVDISNGIKFKCTNCGACCRRPGKVGLRGQDEVDTVETLALAEGIDVRISATKYSDVFQLEAPDGCPLYDGINDQCRLGEDRPFSCKAYPFWPAILRDERLLDHERQLCEGIDHPDGKRYRPKDIVEIIRGKRGGT